MGEDKVLEVENLCVSYGKKNVLKKLNMSVSKGSIYGLVGRNGAGKTTLIRTVSGLIRPKSGSYSLFGISDSSRDILKSRRRMGVVAEMPGLYTELSARENMQLQYSLLGLPSEEGIDEQLGLLKLADTGREKVRNFSLGMKQRLGIAMAMAGNPDFIMLDEPAAGLDPQGIVDLRETLLDLNSRIDITILISSHILEEMPRIATCYGFLKNGQIIKEISSKELKEQCRECLWVKVSDTKLLTRAMDDIGVEYSISSDTEALLYTDRYAGEIAAVLSGQGCVLEHIEDRKETLETFYLNLMGGDECE